MEPLAKHIVVATDFSACSAYAFDYALAWAEQSHAELDIVHVLPAGIGLDIDAAVATAYYQEQEKEARLRLDQLVAQAKECLPGARAHILRGLPADAVCEFASESHADLLVTGTHGWTGLDRVLMGSVAERIVRQAPSPVLTIRLTESASYHEDHESEAQGSVTQQPSSFIPSHLLVPLDFSDCSLDAMEYAAHVAHCFGASITLLHAVEPLSYGLDFQLTHPIENKQFRQKIESRLSELVHALQRAGLTADSLIATKPALDSILDTVVERAIDVIVMGTHGRRGLSRLVIGSVTESVLRHAPCPVLSVKSPKWRHRPTVSSMTRSEKSS
ncbi:MAG: universal stress protein [Nitrospirae bacterium]|nr:MAG: universal stress protein [Nitrospirota bacterium]